MRDAAHARLRRDEEHVGHGRLEGKVALITGGDSGIGRAVAIAFAREGADVRDLLPLRARGCEGRPPRYVEEAGKTATLVAGDLSQAAHCRDLIDRTMAAHGRLDVLVSNAAFQMSHETRGGSPTRSGSTRSPPTCPRCSTSSRPRCRT